MSNYGRVGSLRSNLPEVSYGVRLLLMPMTLGGESGGKCVRNGCWVSFSSAVEDDLSGLGSNVSENIFLWPERPRFV